MRAAFALAVLFLAAACARPLTPAERAFAATVQGRGLEAGRVRVHDGALIGGLVQRRAARPARACRERIRPPEVGTVRTTTAAFVLFERVFVARPFFRRDFLGAYPGTMDLAQAMLLAHELTHVWQWQNRTLTGYHPLKVLAEHRPGTDPYLFALAPRRPFLGYSFEQQGGLVEEFVCCRALDPDGARTAALHALLAPVFPGIERRSGVPRTAISLPAGPVGPGICA